MTGDDVIGPRLVAAVREHLRVAAELDSRLDSLGVDSVRLAGFVTDLEKTFDFRADQDIFDVETLAELADYIGERGGH